MIQKIVEVNKRKHGVTGLPGSLVLHACYMEELPIVLQGVFTGKEGCPIIMLDAMVDFKLWIWHATFGFAGGYNDLS